jgi:hypothetical protein
MIRLLRNIRDLKSFAIRSRVVYEVCGRNFSVKTFDLILNDTAMCNAVVITPRRRKNRLAGRPLKGRLTRVHRKFRSGPPALLFKLSRKGHALLRRLMTQQAAERDAIAQARDQAARAREAKRQARTAKKIERESKETARKTEKARKDLERRTSGFELPPTPLVPARRPTAPQAPAWPYPGPVVAPSMPRLLFGQRPGKPVAPIGGVNLIDKIRKAGYRVNDQGLVAFDNRWIPIDEWRRRMPSVDLG